MNRNKIRISFSFILLFICLFALSPQFITNAQIYVSLNGDDDNPGTLEQPLATIYQALTVLGDYGDTIYVRGGVYNLFSPIKPEKSGNPESKNCLWAYPGENPILDFSTQPFNSAARGIILARKHWYINGFEIRGAGDNGILISGDSNRVEDCIVNRCRDTGIQISSGGSYNEVVNCDSYLNFDSGSRGENADGFAAKLDIGPGNVFRNCRAWSNSDDGWDMYEGGAQVIIDSCWAFNNGYNIWGISGFEGDGNGFKLGGNYVPGNHIIKNSVAFYNRSKGFDQNHNTSGVTVLNCTAWNNGRNYSFPAAPQNSIPNILKNNISYQGSNTIESSAITETNSWQGFAVSNEDFLSLDTSLATIERLIDNNLPQTEFLRLSESSDMIDAGTDVGISYFGYAPELGAFENEIISNIKSESETSNKDESQLFNYPNPFNPSTTIFFSLKQNEFVRIKIFNSLGEELSTILEDYKEAGSHKLKFMPGNIYSGVYYYTIETETFFNSGKMIYLK